MFFHQDPIGKSVDYYKWKGKVIGVVQDFHMRSLRDKIEPYIISMVPIGRPPVLIRLNPGNLADNIKQVERIWHEFVPDWPLNYSFLDEDLNKQYQFEQNLGKIFLKY